MRTVHVIGLTLGLALSVLHCGGGGGTSGDEGSGGQPSAPHPSPAKDAGASTKKREPATWVYKYNETKQVVEAESGELRTTFHLQEMEEGADLMQALQGEDGVTSVVPIFDDFPNEADTRIRGWGFGHGDRGWGRHLSSLQCGIVKNSTQHASCANITKLCNSSIGRIRMAGIDVDCTVLEEIVCGGYAGACSGFSALGCVPVELYVQ